MGDGKSLFSRFRWLIAEVFVIVIGVLIALAVDNYRTESANRDLERIYIQRILADIDSDIAFLSENIGPGLTKKREALEAIAPIVRGQRPVPEDKIQFLTNATIGGIAGTRGPAWYTDTTFRDLLATGNLRLIRDPRIRTAISSLYQMLEANNERVDGRRTGYVLFIHSVLPAELRDKIDRQSIEEFGVEFAMERLTSDEFRELLNAEMNLLLFMEGLQTEAYMEKLRTDLKNYLSTF